MNHKPIARSLLAGFLCISGALSAAAAATQEPKPMEPTKNGAHEIVTPSGLKYTDIQLGPGAGARSGTAVQVHYPGWLLDGPKFASSRDRNQPFPFKLGAGQVIKGW